MKIVKYYENRQKAKTAIVGLRKAFDSRYHAKVYVQNEGIWLEIDVQPDDVETADGILIHGTNTSEDNLPPIVECHEFYRGQGLTRFQPYYGRRR
jgi:hypothetical protein